MLILDDARLAALVNMDIAISAVRRAAVTAAEGGLRLLAKQRVSQGGRTMHVLGAVRASAASPLAQQWSSTTTYITGGNNDRATVLFNGERGPVAVLTGRDVARLRTGAASAVSVDASVRPGAVNLTLLGAGYQAWGQVEAITRVRPIHELLVWSRTFDNAKQFAANVAATFDLNARPIERVVDGLRSADVVIAVTKASSPIILGADLSPGCHIVLAGSSHLNRAEADPHVFARASAVSVGDLDLARAHSGDIHAAVDHGSLAWEDVITLGEAIFRAPNRALPGDDAISVFCSQGLGSWDLELAIEAYRRAREQ